MAITRSARIKPLDGTQWDLLVLQPFDIYGSLSLFGSELSNATVKIDNGRRTLPAEKWLFADCDLIEAGVVVFTGVIRQIEISSVVALTIEPKLMTDIYYPVSTTVFDQFRNAEYIPTIYGSAVIKPIQIDRAGKRFVVASHPCQAVVGVIRNEKLAQGFTWKIEDGFTILELASPLALTETLWAQVIGYAITNPAHIITHITGMTGLESFARDCTNNGLEFGGALTEPEKYKSIVDSIAGDCVAWWAAPNAPQLIWVEPNEDAVIRHTTILTDRIESDKVYGILEYNYNMNHANGTSMSLVKLKSKADYTAPTESYTARWVKTQALALKLARKRLEYTASIRKTTSLDTPNTARLGQSALGGIVISATRANATTALSIETAITAPKVAITSITASSAFNVAQTSIGIQFENGILTLTILDDDDNPVKGAEVSLDSRFTQTTDGFGIVRFAGITEGEHSVVILAEGFEDLKYEFTL